MNILLTGGLGFIGSHFIEEILKRKEIKTIVNIDKMTYAANKSLFFENDSRYIFIKKDINDHLNSLFFLYDITHVVHFAAESHVDNSIKNSKVFIDTNINGTYNLLESARQYNKLKKFIHVSTDEVFGSLSFADKSFNIKSQYKPNSPYAASKAASDLLVRSYRKTYKLPTIITNCSNNFGPRQFPEKLIPLALSKLKNNEQIPIYGNGKNIRDWIYVKDHVRILIDILLNEHMEDQYLIGGNNEISNIDLINIIKNRYELISKKTIRQDYIKYVEDRKGHDLRYAIENSFKFKFTDFNFAIDETIKSYL